MRPSSPAGTLDPVGGIAADDPRGVSVEVKKFGQLVRESSRGRFGPGAELIKQQYFQATFLSAQKSGRGCL